MKNCKHPAPPRNDMPHSNFDPGSKHQLSHVSSTTSSASQMMAFHDEGAFGNGSALEGSLSLVSILEACFRHRMRFLVVAGITIAVSIVAAFLMPKRHQANMQLLVLNARENPVISPDAAELMKPASQITDSDVNSQAELLRSRDVLSGALDQVGQLKTPGPARDKAIEVLSRNMDTSPVRQSDILNCTSSALRPA